MKLFAEAALIVFIILCCALSAHATELSGVVKSETGKPLSGVRVYSDAPMSGARTEDGFKTVEAITDRTGAFKLPGHGRIVYFKRQDLRPLTKVVALSSKRLDVAMVDAASSTWKVPLCSDVSDKAQRVGFNFMVNVLDGVITKKIIHLGSEMYYWGFYVGERPEVMFHWVDSTSDEPSDEYILNSTKFSERLWTSGKTTGYEARGVKSNGQLWRRVSFRWGAISYQNNSAESARVFDAMIDSMCFIESEQE